MTSAESSGNLENRKRLNMDVQPRDFFLAILSAPQILPRVIETVGGANFGQFIGRKRDFLSIAPLHEIMATMKRLAGGTVAHDFKSIAGTAGAQLNVNRNASVNRKTVVEQIIVFGRISQSIADGLHSQLEIASRFGVVAQFVGSVHNFIGSGFLLRNLVRCGKWPVLVETERVCQTVC
jgi:hypothetical protein